MMFEGLGSVSWLPIAVFVLANENRTQDAGHAFLRQTRNPKVRKNPGVIDKLEFNLNVLLVFTNHL